MSIYSGNTFNDFGELLVGVQVKLTALPSTIEATTYTDREGRWKIDINDIENDNVKITFIDAGRVIYSITHPLPTGIIDRISPQAGGTLNLKGKYPAGKYYITSLESTVKEDIDKQLEAAYKFVKLNPGNYRLYIESSESRVTNYDREPSSRTNGKELTPTATDEHPLARRRAEALQKYANDFFLNKYNTENPVPTGFILPEVQIRSITTGGTEYNTQVDAIPYGGDPYSPLSPKAESFKNEQFTKIIAEFITQPIIEKFEEDVQGCVRNLEIIIEGGNHQCDSAVFKVYLNDVVLLRNDSASYASLNNFANSRQIGKEYHGLSQPRSVELQKYDNAISGYQSKNGDPAGNRSNIFIVTDEIARQALANNPNELTISLACYNPTNYYEDAQGFALLPNARETGFWEYNCHKGVGSMSLKSTNGRTRDIQKVSTPEVRDEIIPVIILSPCTLGVIKSPGQLADRRRIEKDIERRGRIKNLSEADERIYGKIKGLKLEQDFDGFSDEEFRKRARALNPSDAVRALFIGL
jgi:hypothetical protein